MPLQDDVQIISVDDHVIEHPNVWQDRLPEKFKELGPKGIRAHAISPGSIATRAASGLERFDELLERAAASAPARHRVDIADVGALAAFLVSDAAHRITGTIIPVDVGQHLLA